VWVGPFPVPPHDAGQPGLARQINRLNERRRILG
jgi:hypothetical protein